MDGLIEGIRNLAAQSQDRPTTPTPAMGTGTLEPEPAGVTPTKLRVAHGSEYRSSGLENRRRLLVQDLESALELPFEQFMEHLLPQLATGIKVDAICQEMDRHGSWGLHFPTEPAKSNTKETQLFDGLVPLFTEMCSMAQKQMKTTKMETPQSFRLQTVANTAPQADIIKSTFRPDMVLIKCSSPSLSWEYIAGSGEVKKKESDEAIDDNVLKIVYTMQHILSVDPCRRFTLAFTIENTSLRLWFADRSLLIRSTPIAFPDEKKALTAVFLSIAFASEIDMGWDPTIKRIDGVNPAQYRIEVDGETYTTDGIIISHGADGLLGRGTRVFKARDKDHNKVALKILWLERTRKSERTIYLELLQDIEDIFSKTDKDHAARFLMTPEREWRVQINNKPDETKSCTLLAKEVDLKTWTPLLKGNHRPGNPNWNSQTYARGSEMEADDVHIRKHPFGGPEICHRQQYRVVYKELAIPMHKVTNLGDVCTIMADAIEVLKFVHGCGWVHRDISVGNLYLYVDGNEPRGLLADLEYAKRTCEISNNKVRTGTIDFMAVEAIALQHLFVPGRGRGVRVQPYLSEEQTPNFTYFALHDLESVWWTGIWMVFFKYTQNNDKDSHLKSKRQEMTEKVFPGTNEYGFRTLFLEKEHVFISTMAKWPSLAFSAFIALLNGCLQPILDLYTQTEATFPEGTRYLIKKVDKRTPGTTSPPSAFPGAKEDVKIHSTLLDMILKASSVGNFREIKFASVKPTTN